MLAVFMRHQYKRVMLTLVQHTDILINYWSQAPFTIAVTVERPVIQECQAHLFVDSASPLEIINEKKGSFIWMYLFICGVWIWSKWLIFSHSYLNICNKSETESPVLRSSILHFQFHFSLIFLSFFKGTDLIGNCICQQQRTAFNI